MLTNRATQTTTNEPQFLCIHIYEEAGVILGSYQLLLNVDKLFLYYACVYVDDLNNNFTSLLYFNQTNKLIITS